MPSDDFSPDEKTGQPNNDRQPLAGSFRDPSGFLFVADGQLYRQVNDVYRAHYDLAVSSGLYRKLIEKKLLVSHEEVSMTVSGAYRVLKPTQLPFISYPYEWSFSQLQDAARLTLQIQSIALDHGLSLKDASAYNVQFLYGRPIFIDTLSFEKYEPGQPWIAYRQFCQHFLAPLALMAHRDVRLGQLLRIHVDGIPLDLACRLLPFRLRFNPELAGHLFLHAASQKRFADRPKPVQEFRLDPKGLRTIISSLTTAIDHLHWRPAGTEWGEYYDHTNYSSDAIEAKAKMVDGLIDRIRPSAVWDLGANTGKFSRLASRRGIQTVAMDYDPAAVERMYLDTRSANEPIMPLLMDLTNPSPALGWAHEERRSLSERGPVDCVLALALIHHLAIGNNLPFRAVAKYMAELGQALVVEFVPKEDSQVKRLLTGRPDVFSDYQQSKFEQAFAEYFTLDEQQGIPGTARTLYRMTKRP